MTKIKAVAVVKRPAQQQVMSPDAMIAQAIDRGLTVETIERLVALKERMEATAAKKAYHEAMAAFQAECPIIRKGTVVKNKLKAGEKEETVRYRYAALEDIVEQVRPFLMKHGFSYGFDTEDQEKKFVVICTASHIGGHSESGRFGADRDPDAYMSVTQKTGAVSTFAKRYAFCNKFGITVGGEDTDANPPANEPTVASTKDMENLKKIIDKSDAKGIKKSLDGVKTSKKYSNEQKEQILGWMDARMSQLPDGEPVK